MQIWKLIFEVKLTQALKDYRDIEAAKWIAVKARN